MPRPAHSASTRSHNDRAVPLAAHPRPLVPTALQVAFLVHGVAADAIGPLRYATFYAAACIVCVWPLWCLLVLPGAPWASFVAMALLGALAGGGTSVAALTVRRLTRRREPGTGRSLATPSSEHPTPPLS